MYNYDNPISEPKLTPQQRFAKNLRFLRIANSKSQEELCGEIGISRAQYSCLESGAKEATFSQLYALSLLYHISLEHLLSIDLSQEVMCLLQEKFRLIESRNFLQNFLALSPKNRMRILEELAELSQINADSKGEMK